MRTLFRSIVIAAVLASVNGFAQDASPPPAAASVDALGQGIVAALVSGSFEAMEHLLPSPEDVIEIIEMQAERQGGIPEERLAEMRREAPEIVGSIREALQAEFASLREPWREIDWSTVTMKGVRINVRDPDSHEEREVDEATLVAEQRPGADVQVLIETAGRTLEIDLQDCVKTSRGWLVMEKLRLKQ